MPKSSPTWIVVMDGAHARIFDLRMGEVGDELRLAAPALEAGLARYARDERSDKPGRSFSSGGGGVRHAIEPKHDYHKLAKHNFTCKVADAIEAGASARLFEKLILVAPKRSLGELRALLADSTKARIEQEIAKDLTAHAPKALWSRISPLLPQKPVSTVNFEGKQKREKAPASSAIVLFRHLDPSAAIEASVVRHAEKLRRMHARITSCKAIVEGSRGHHRKGPLYRVDLDVRLPRRTISATSAGARTHAHEDVYVAIREAFAAARRQIQDRVRRSSHASPQEARSSSLRSRRSEGR